MNQILLYDENQMRIFNVVGYFPTQPRFEEVEATTIEDVVIKREIVPNWSHKAEITTGEVKAEFDPTTMMRIAKYNLEKDFDELNEKIKSAEERLKRLNAQAVGKEAKLEFMAELLRKIWKDAYFDPDNYLPEDDDYCEEE